MTESKKNELIQSLIHHPRIEMRTIRDTAAEVLLSNYSIEDLLDMLLDRSTIKDLETWITEDVELRRSYESDSN
jgi:hypothetical protein